jgi:hypothetical protein
LTLFEYLAAAYVLMLSFAVLRAISGVPYAVRSPHRYWVHISWLATALSLCFVCFWAFWPYRGVEWTLFTFGNALAIPALVYAHNSLVVPPDPSLVESWRDHFFNVRAPLFATGAILMATVTISNQSALGVAPLHPSQLGNYAVIALYLVGFVSKKPGVHAGLAVAFPSVVLVYVLSQATTPDSIFHPLQ